MKITVFGASGKVGKRFIKQALDAGHEVTAFIHKKQLKPHPALSIHKGDIYKPADVEEAISGSDVVVSALGSWGRVRKDILSTGMRHIIPAMKAHHVSRIVTLTGADVRDEVDALSSMHHIMHTVLFAIAHRTLKDGESHITLLRESGLEWTVLRSPAMNNVGQTNNFVFSEKRPLPWQTVLRDDVARAILRLLEQNIYIHQCPFIVRK